MKRYRKRVLDQLSLCSARAELRNSRRRTDARVHGLLRSMPLAVGDGDKEERARIDRVIDAETRCLKERFSVVNVKAECDFLRRR